MFKKNGFKIGLVLILLLVLGLFVLSEAVTPNRVITGLQVKGWLWGTSTIRGTQTWGTTGTADTLLVSGVDTDCYVFLQAQTAMGNLRYTISADGDTVFVTSASSETGSTDKYNYWIVR